MSLYILDSDHLSLYQRGHKTLYPYLSSIPPEQMAITIISVEELLARTFSPSTSSGYASDAHPSL
jgi:hypothetical protein